MSVYKRKDSDNWWYKFTWRGEPIRESTKQTNKRVAEQIEAAHKARLAKGEVGIRDRKPVPTLRDFLQREFQAHIDTQFAGKPKTALYYANGIRHLLEYAQLADCKLDSISADKVAGYTRAKRENGYKVTSVNRLLEVLRRSLKLAAEWGTLEKAPPRVSSLPGEIQRGRVLTIAEEKSYLAATQSIGDKILRTYESALEGIRATLRGEEPRKPRDPYLLRDATTILLDCGLRPEEAYRIRWEDVRDGLLHVTHGKTANARRVIPLTKRAAAILEMRRSTADSPWLFPAETQSGHIEPSTLKKRHADACKRAGVKPFVLYTLRHTCLTKWAAVMDPYTLGYLAGHSHFATTKRYVHPEAGTVRAAMERAQEVKSGHGSGHSSRDGADHDIPQESVIN